MEDDKGMLGLDYSALISPLVEAVKELKAENDNQADEIEELRVQLEAANDNHTADITELRSEIEAMKSAR